jgi:hypothetical protein
MKKIKMEKWIQNMESLFNNNVLMYFIYLNRTLFLYYYKYTVVYIMGF